MTSPHQGIQQDLGEPHSPGNPEPTPSDTMVSSCCSSICSDQGCGQSLCCHPSCCQTTCCHPSCHASSSCISSCCYPLLLQFQLLCPQRWSVWLLLPSLLPDCLVSPSIKDFLVVELHSSPQPRVNHQYSSVFIFFFFHFFRPQHLDWLWSVTVFVHPIDRATKKLF